MSERRSKKWYNEDMIVLFLAILLLFGTYAAIDLSGEVPLWYQNANPSPNGIDDGNGGGPPVNGGVETKEERILEESGYTSEGSSSEVSFELLTERVVELTISLTWSDDYGSNDEFGLSLELEGDEIDRTSGTSGTLVLTIDPPSTGNYSIIITAINCPGIIGPIPDLRDTGNDWTVEAKDIYEIEA